MNTKGLLMPATALALATFAAGFFAGVYARKDYCKTADLNVLDEQNYKIQQQAITIETLKETMGKVSADAYSREHADEAALDKCQTSLQGWLTFAQDYETSFTVIYEPGQWNLRLSPLSKGLMGALFQGVTVPDTLDPPKPRWVIKGRNFPQVVGSPSGLAFRIYDASANQFVGPVYAPKPVQQ